MKSLVAFPQVLSMMNTNLDWTQKVGDAMIGQQKDVADSIQRLRAKAAAAALVRRRWIKSATSFCWPIIASPTLWVQSRLVFIIDRTCGKATSDFTLTSQLLSLTAATAASPLRLGLACDQRAASTTSSG